MGKLIAKIFSPSSQIFIATIIWGSSYFIVKQITTYISPAFLIFYRFLIATLFIGVIIIITKRDFSKSIKQGIIFGIIYSLTYLCQTIGLQSISSSNSSFISGLFVITTPIFSYLIFKIIPSKNFFIALIISIIGLWILTKGVSQMKYGEFITLLVPFFTGLHSVLSEKFLKKNHDPFVLCFHQMWTMSIFCLIIGIISGMPILPKSNLIILPIIYLAIFPSAIATLLKLNALRSISANKASIINSLEPVFASFFAWSLIGETLSINTFFGGSLIFLAMIISEIKLKYNVPKLII